MILPGEKFREVILKAGLVTEGDLPELESYAVTTGIGLDDVLIEKGITTDEKIGQLVAASLGVPFVSLARVQIPEKIFAIVPERLARKQKMIAFSRDDAGIKVAMVGSWVFQKTSKRSE